MNFTEAGIVTGIVGDFLLQTFFKGKYGLRPYFDQHGSMESLFIAGGMMGYFCFIAQYFGWTSSWTQLMVYGGALDIFFRESMIMESLRSYYDENGRIFTIIWGGLPFIIASSLFSIINKIII